MTPAEKRRRFRDLAKRAPVKTARQLEAEQAQLELDFTPAKGKPARRPGTKHPQKTTGYLTKPPQNIQKFIP